MAEFKTAGQGPTMWAVLIFFGLLVIVGILLWLRKTEHSQPTAPTNPRPTSMRTAPPRRLLAECQWLTAAGQSTK